MLAHRTAAQTSRSDTNPQLLDRLADYIAQTFPEEHRRDVTAATISEVLTQRVCASEEKLLTEVLEDEHGLAAIMLVKERRSPLTGELEGHVCCFAPLRPDLSSEQVANRLQELTDRHGWTCLRTSLFMSDEKWGRGASGRHQFSVRLDDHTEADFRVSAGPGSVADRCAADQQIRHVVCAELLAHRISRWTSGRIALAIQRFGVSCR